MSKYTTAEVAAHFHVKASTVRTWVTEGCPAEQRGKGKPILFEIDKVKTWRASSSSTGANLDPQREKALLDRERRLKVATERRVLEGKLIEAEKVEAYWGQMVGAARAKLLSLPMKIAPVVVSCETVGDIEDEARRLINESLEELAGTGMPDMEATARPDDQPVGGQVQKTKPGGKRGKRAVADKAVPAGDTGRTQ